MSSVFLIYVKIYIAFESSASLHPAVDLAHNLCRYIYMIISPRQLKRCASRSVEVLGVIPVLIAN